MKENLTYEMNKYKAEKELEDFFIMVYERANTYFLSDYLENELVDHISDDFEAQRLLAIYSDKKEQCKKFGIDIHEVSMNVSEKWILENDTESWLHTFGSGHMDKEFVLEFNQKSYPGVKSKIENIHYFRDSNGFTPIHLKKIIGLEVGQHWDVLNTHWGIKVIRTK